MPGYSSYASQDEDLGPTLSGALVETFEQAMAEREGRQLGLYNWSLGVPEPKTGTLDFDRYPFQKELYTDLDDVRDVVVMKATQVGVSAYLVRWTMHAADVQGKTSLYVFPKLQNMLHFSDSRIRPLIAGSERLRDRVLATHVQNKSLKQIGLGFVHFRGSESRDGLESVDADRLALDEYELLVQAHIPIAEQRLSNSADPRIRRVGWPRIPDGGVDGQYQESDQRHWLVKCEKAHCRENWQQIDFYENVDIDRALVVCKSCASPLDVRKGKWVAKYPDREKRGYHLPRTIVPHQDLRQMIRESVKKKPYERENFYNRWLGMPYVSDENRLSTAALNAAEREYTMMDGYVGDALVTMGVDVASARALNVRISLHRDDENRKGALWIGEVEDFDTLDRLMIRYDVKMCVIDHMPEHRLARAFAEKHPGRVYLARYASPTTIKPFDVDEEMGVVSVQRVVAIDATLDMIRAQRNELPINRPADYNRQMQSVVRVTERDEFDRVVQRYEKTGGDDDYVHAEVYDLLAKEVWLVRQTIDESQLTTFSQADDMLEFKRYDLDSETQDYSPGRAMDEYNLGFDGDE